MPEPAPAVSMRRQLLTWVLPIALLVLAAFSACAYLIARQALLSQARRAVETLTVAAAARVEAFFAQRESDLLAAAESPLLRDHYRNAEFGLREETSEALRAVEVMLLRLSQRTGVYPGLVYLDAAGRELCRVGAPRARSKRLLERLRAAVPGEVVIDEDVWEGVVRYAAAVSDERGRRRGALVLDCSLAKVEEFLGSLKVGASGRARLAPRRADGKAPDLSGAKVTAAAPVGRTPWAVEVEAERGEFLGGLDRLREATLVFLAAAALLLCLGIARQTAILLRPLHRLEAAARGYAEGRFEERLSEEGPRELQTVAGAFNAMAERLSERTRELQARVRELSALQRLSEWALVNAGRSEVAEVCLQAAVEGLGFKRGSLYLVDEAAGVIRGECVHGTEGSDLSREAVRRRRVPLKDADILTFVYRTRRPVTVRDPLHDARCDPAFVEEAGTKGFAMAPVLAGERVLAIIGVDLAEDGAPDEGATMALAMFCAAAGVVLDHARLLSELKASEGRYRASVEYSPAAVVDLDADKRIVLWNRAARELFGYAEREALGRTLDLVGLELKTGRFEAKAKTKDGRTLDVSVNCTRTSEEWFVVIEDETAEKALREQLLHAEKLSAAGRMLAGLNHELNSPLQAVTGRAELALESTGAEHAEDLKAVYAQAMRCRDIVGGLLRFVRQESAAVERVSLNAVVEESVRLMDYRIEKKENCRLRLSLSGSRPEVAGDFHQLEQVLVNLLMNACDAVSGRADREIRVSTLMKDDACELWVEDTGPGVSEEARRRIFEPFFTTKAAEHGTGLGLAISAQIVRDMGGTLCCEEAFEGGARFVARLPLCPKGVSARPPRVDDLPEPRPGKRVLIVDDEPEVVEYMDRLARADGLVTAVEGGVAAAWARLLKEPFDLVVADVEMDGRRGLELLRLRKNGSPRFVFVTGDTLNAALRKEAAELGVPLLGKPFMRVDFLREVRKGLAGV